MDKTHVNLCQGGCNTEYKRKDGLDLFADFIGEMILKYADVIDIASLTDSNNEEPAEKMVFEDRSVESKQ